MFPFNPPRALWGTLLLLGLFMGSEKSSSYRARVRIYVFFCCCCFIFGFFESTFFDKVHSPLPTTCYMSRVRKTENCFGDLHSLKIRSFYPPSQKLPQSTGANHPGKIQNFIRLYPLYNSDSLEVMIT